MRLVDIESESFLNEMREKQNACKEMIQSSDGATPTWTERDHWEGVYGSFVEMALTLKKQPTIDAVPLDKLCEWLSSHAYKKTGYYITDPGEARYAHEWEHDIREWMEETP